MKKTILTYSLGCYLVVFLIVGPSSCLKQNDFLNAKPDQTLVVPATLQDYQSILNNTNIFNSANDPAVGELSTDDFYIQQSYFNADAQVERNAYTWAQHIFDPSQDPPDWVEPYQQVYYANTVLDGLQRIKYAANQQALFNQLKGEALFYRSYAFYNLVQTFALPYNPQTAVTDLGIPLRLTSDITIKSLRATEQACYDQVISDLKTALSLLPLKTQSPTTPSQTAANAMLARVYLGMSDYKNALLFANACLAEDPVLTDYNTLNSPTTTAISSELLNEDIYHSALYSYTSLVIRRETVVDSNLYATYADNDLRKTKFFAILDNMPQYPRFVGSYDFLNGKFDGLATDEIYLIQAECLARAGDAADAMKALNTLLQTRWLNGTFIPYTATSADDALVQVLKERRKELVFRGLRWTDLRRLNLENRFKTSLIRNIDSTTFTLPPNNKRYAFPVPQSEISISGLTQNQR